MWSEKQNESTSGTAHLRSSAHSAVTSSVTWSICLGSKNAYCKKCCAFSSTVQQPYSLQILSSVSTTPLAGSSVLASSVTASRNCRNR